MSLCCPCDVLIHPVQPDIPAGLDALPRQLAGFPEYRLAMLRDIPTYAPLARWRARSGDDLGIMLVEMWAYVLDILGFYDERIANESYLRTALLRPSLRKLAGLIGYLPRPALAAAVELAAIADGVKAVTLPPQTAFRSDAFDGEPPQVFETEVVHTIHPLTNQWTLGVVRDRLPGETILFETGTAAVARGQLILFRWPSGTTTELRAGRVTAVQTVTALDGANYVSPEITPAPGLDPSVELAAVAVLSPSTSAVPNLFASSPVSDTTGIILDAFYSGLAVQDPVLIQRDNALHAALITGVFRENVVLAAVTDAQNTPVPTIPATRITISPALPSGWAANPERLVIHFRMIDAGTITRPAKTHLNTTDFALPGAPIEGIVEPLPESVSAPSEILLLDAADDGVSAAGSVSIDAGGAGRVLLAVDTQPFEPALRTPVTVFGNVVAASRGESVFNEVLGSGDASRGFQAMTLAKKPLTYFNDAFAPNGRRSSLQVRVNGILWKEVPSFFGAGPQDEVYIVRQNDAGESAVTFGDGRTGARLPSGVDNVTATYRFGAGAAKPPAGAIGQLARPVKGLRRVVNPVAAGGGADADQPKDLRKNAPTSALILGRAVSLPDFEALAREFGGVVNAHAEWAWNEATQGAAVKVWFISDGGDIGTELRAFLIGQTDPNTPLVAVEAQAQPTELVIDLEIDARFNAQAVSAQVEQALTNPETGILAPQNIPIGSPLFCSRIFEVVLSVEGVLAVRAITVDGIPASFAIGTVQGGYRDFLGNLLIQATATADMPVGA
jgi:predicted phage baseplate assembly protein